MPRPDHDDVDTGHDRTTVGPGHDDGRSTEADARERTELWNDALADGFRLALVAGLAVSAGMLWSGVDSAAVAANAVLMVVGLPALAVRARANRSGVPVPRWTARSWWSAVRSRSVRPWSAPAAVALALLTIGGLFHIGPSETTQTWTLVLLGALASHAAVTVASA